MRIFLIAAALFTCALASQLPEAEDDVCNVLRDSLAEMDASLPGCAMEAGADVPDACSVATPVRRSLFSALHLNVAILS